MPIYEYICVNDHGFEALVRHNAPETGENSESEIQCPICQTTSKTRLFSSFSTSNGAIHASERPVIFRNPKTGEIRYPATKDAPLHPKYAAQGYVKEFAFDTFKGRDEFERKTGKIHEASHYDNGSATAERDLDPGDLAKKAWDKIKHKIRPLGSL